MPKKVLFCATVVSHLRQFHVPYLRWFKEQGWEVHTAASGMEPIPYSDLQIPLSIQRSPFKRDNLKAYQELKELIRQHRYDLIHCHTPMGGALTRLAARQARRTGTKVIYTAHGFHFFDGAPLLYWLVYYPVEKLLSRYTDCLITMNQEDYERAVARRFRAGSIVKVHGVGVDFNKFKPVSAEQKSRLREEYGIGQERFVLVYAAELSWRKNQTFLLQAVARLRARIPEMVLLLAGQGQLEPEYRKLTDELDLGEHVIFLGHRTDMPALYALADLAVTTSRQEGLPVHVMEAIASGLPVVATDVRGNRDLVKDGVHGFVVKQGDAKALDRRIWELYAHPRLRKELGGNRHRLTELHDVDHVLSEVIAVYRAAASLESETDAKDSAMKYEGGGLEW